MHLHHIFLDAYRYLVSDASHEVKRLPVSAGLLYSYLDFLISLEDH